MAKKQTQSLTNQSTAKKPVEVVPAEKMQLEEVTSQVEVASTSRKKETVVNASPESPSDDEEMESEEDGEEAETDSSSEEEDSGKNPQTPPSAIVAATVIQSSDSESGSETDESGESDSETEPPPPDTKRAKTESETETAKKGLFQRLWSKEDEIALLQGMLKFKTETRKNPSDDYHALYETVKESNYLEDKSYNQYSSKIGSLKNKYWKKKKTYTKAHDLKCFELCEKIWGTYLVSSTAAVKSKKKMTVEVDSGWFERSNLVGHITNYGVVDEVAVKEKWSKVSVEMKKKLEEKWKVWQEADFQGLRLRTELVSEVSSAISNV